MTPSTPPASTFEPSSSAPTRGLAWTRDDWLAVVLIVTGVIVALARFWQPGIAGQSDMLMAIHRVVELEHAWQQGIVYPRLGLDLNFTYTAPLFEFYPPLASYLALVLRLLGLGWIEAVKGVFTLSLTLGGLGVYGYARWLFQNRLAAMVSSLAFVFAPYLLLTIYERGALAEGLAWGLTPWLFWAAHRLVEQDRRRDLLATAGLTAVLMLAHNVTALFVLPAVAVYAALLAWRGGNLGRLPALAAAFALGLGLSAFYWVPALAEARFTRMEVTMFGPALTAANHLTPLGSLVQPKLVFDPWGPSRFHLALWPTLLGLAALLVLPVQAPKVRLPLALLAGLWLVVMALQLTLARPFWEAAPLVRSIQFPWRLLGLASFCIDMLVGSAFLWPPLQSRAGALLAAVLVGGMVLLSTRQLKPELSPNWFLVDNGQITRIDLFERGRAGYALFSDYQSIFQELSSPELSQSRPDASTALPPLDGSPQVELVAQSPLAFAFRVSSETAFPLRLHRIFFPGWRATVDGQPAPVTASGLPGLATVEMPAGEHAVNVSYRGTTVQHLAGAISLASLAVFVVLLARTRRGRMALLASAVGALALMALVAMQHAFARPEQQPVPVAAHFGDEIDLIGAFLPQAAWQPGEAALVRFAWFARRAPSADYKVFVHLVPLDDSGAVAQADSPPLFGFSPTTRWEPGEVVVDEHLVQLDSNVPPGRYRLIMGLYRPDTVQNLPIESTAEVLPGDRLQLAEIVVGEP